VRYGVISATDPDMLGKSGIHPQRL
jgi:hypothetical protein